MTRRPFFEAMEAAPGKPSGLHAHPAGTMCTCQADEPIPEPEKVSLAADILRAIVALITRRTP